MITYCTTGVCHPSGYATRRELALFDTHDKSRGSGFRSAFLALYRGLARLNSTFVVGVLFCTFAPGGDEAGDSRGGAGPPGPAGPIGFVLRICPSPRAPWPRPTRPRRANLVRFAHLSLAPGPLASSHPAPPGKLGSFCTFVPPLPREGFVLSPHGARLSLRAGRRPSLPPRKRGWQSQPCGLALFS
jgi:hypothetical protein